MRDSDIRLVVRQRLTIQFGHDPATLILDELGLCEGKVRADLAVVNGSLKGFEIKSDQDTLKRLAVQASIYNKIFDTVTIIVTHHHLEEIETLVPAWWGIILAERNDNRSLRLQLWRDEGLNESHDPFALAQLLWRDEVLELLRYHNLNAGLSSRPRKYLWEALVKNFSLCLLREIVRNQLKLRRTWRVDRSQKRYGGKSLLFAM
jgi:hypothetical protein